MQDSTKRFSDRVDNYVKYRPSYPKELITFLIEKVGLSKVSTVADIGSGTGIFSNLIKYKVKTLYSVTGVFPVSIR